MSNDVSNLFNAIRERLARKVAELPEVLGNEIVNTAIDAFDNQGWEGTKWEKRKSKKDPERAIGVKSGRLKRSPRVIRTNANGGTVGTDVPYARRFNEGGDFERAARSETFVRNRYKRGEKKGRFRKGTTDGQGLSFKAHSVHVPARTFLKNTPALRKHLREVMIEHIRSR